MKAILITCSSKFTGDPILLTWEEKKKKVYQKMHIKKKQSVKQIGVEVTKRM